MCGCHLGGLSIVGRLVMIPLTGILPPPPNTGLDGETREDAGVELVGVVVGEGRTWPD